MRQRVAHSPKTGDTLRIVGTPTVAQNTLAMPAYHECGASYLTNSRHRLAARLAMRGVCSNSGSRDVSAAGSEERPCSRRSHRSSKQVPGMPISISAFVRNGMNSRAAQGGANSSFMVRPAHWTPECRARCACTPSPHDTFRSMNERRRPTRRGRGHRPPNRPPLDSNIESSPYRDDSSLPAPSDTALPDTGPARLSDGGNSGIPAPPPQPQPPYASAAAERSRRSWR